MNGELLKARLLKIEPVMAELARKLDTTPQSLNQTLGAADIKTGFVEQLAALFGKPIGYFFGEKISIDDHSRKDDHSSLFGDTEHYEGADAMLMAKLQVAEERIKSLERQLEDKKALLDDKDARIAELQKMNDFLMNGK